MKNKIKFLATMLMSIVLSVNVWGADVTHTWTLPFSSTTNEWRAANNSTSAQFGACNSNGNLNGGKWTNISNGSHLNLPSSGYFLVKVPITSSTTSFTLNASIFAWASNKYAAKNVTITYYTSKNTTEAAICNGATTTSGCYNVSQEITLPNSYVVTSNGTLFIKIAVASGNDGFEALSVTTKSGSTKADVTLTPTQNAGNVMVNDIVEDLSTWYTVSPAAYDGTITYTSSDEDVFAEDEGAGYAFSTGTCNLYINAPETSNYKAANCTIQVTVSAPAVKHKVNWYVNGTKTKTDEVAEGATIELPTNPGAPEGCEEKSFFGWAKSAIDGETDDALTVYASETMSTADIDFYAVFADKEGEGENGWVKITNAGDIVAGVYAVISYDEAYYLPTSASTSNPTATAVTKTDDKIDILDAMKWNLTISEGVINLESATTAGVYAWGGSANDGVRVNSTSAKANATKDWRVKTTTNYGLVLYNNATTDDRYLSTYETTDWRNYTSTSSTNRAANLYKLENNTTYSGFVTTCKACESEVAVTKAACENGSFTVSKETVCADDAGGSVTVTCTPNEHYHVSAVTATVGSVTGSGNSYTVSGITAATTISATFVEAAKYTVTWKVKGVTVKSTQVYVGETDAAPAVADVDIPTTCANAFVGWSISTLTGTGHGAPPDLFNTTSPEITADRTFNAVFATASSGSGTVFHSQPGTITSGDYYLVDTYNGVDYQGNATACSYRALKGGLLNSGTTGGIQCVNICDAVSVNDNVLTLDMSHLDDSQKPDAYTITVNESSVSFALNGTTFYCQGDNVNADMTTSTTNSYNWNEITNETGDYVGRHMLKVSHGTGTRCLMVLDHTSHGNNANYCKVYALNNSTDGGTQANEQSYGSGKLYFIPAVSVTYSNYVTSCATYTVTFKSNGADVTSVSNVAPGQQVTAPTWAEIRTEAGDRNVCTNYLVGWSTNSHYSNPSDAPDDILKPNAEGKITIPSNITEDVTYYAVYADVVQQ